MQVQSARQPNRIRRRKRPQVRVVVPCSAAPFPCPGTAPASAGSAEAALSGSLTAVAAAEQVFPLRRSFAIPPGPYCPTCCTALSTPSGRCCRSALPAGRWAGCGSSTPRKTRSRLKSLVCQFKGWLVVTTGFPVWPSIALSPLMIWRVFGFQRTWVEHWPLSF